MSEEQEDMDDGQTESASTRYWLTNDLLSFIIIPSAIVTHSILGLQLPQWFKILVFGAGAWAFGSSFYEEYKALNK